MPAQADDGIARAWQAVFLQRRVAPEHVTAIACEWEPTDADQQFIKRSFPNLKNARFMFERPGPDGWQAAFERAETTRAAAMRDRPDLAGYSQVAQCSTPERHDAMPSDFVLLPLLRTGPHPPLPSAYRTLIPHALYVCAANVCWTPRKTLEMQWVLQRFLDDEFTFAGVLEEAFANLAPALKIEKRSTEDGSERVLVYVGETALHMPAAVVALPGFHQRISQLLGGDRFLAGISCHHHLDVMRADSSLGWYLRGVVFEHDHIAEGLAPTLLLVERDGMRIIEQKGTPSAHEPWAP